MQINNLSIIIILQAGIFILIAPLNLSALRWMKARLQGRQGPDLWQMYRDLWKLLRRPPLTPDSASFVFRTAPYLIFGCHAFLGLLLPILYLPAMNGETNFPAWPFGDLLAIIYLLGLARFAGALAGMDPGAPFGGMGSARQMFIHFLIEPSLLLIVVALALLAHTTGLTAILHTLQDTQFLFNPLAWLILLALLEVTLADNGRIPFDNPHTHLELTMIDKAAQMEYSGHHLALIEWAAAMRLTFFLTLTVNLLFPMLLASPAWEAWYINLALCIAYPYKLLGMLAILSFWEVTRARLRLSAIGSPAGLALILSSLAIVMIMLNKE